MTILRNAVESVQIGMEDYHNDDPRRVLSAIRNIYAGLLLIFKHKLQELSPEGSNDSLLKAKLELVRNPETGSPVWLGSGNKTLEVDQIETRLKAMGIDGISWSNLRTLRFIRNDVEHSFSQKSVSMMKEAVAGSLKLLTEFCEPHLKQHPSKLFGQECWDMMLAVSSFHEAEVVECQRKLAKVEWPYKSVAASVSKMRCDFCDSQLLRWENNFSFPHGDFECLACGYESDYTSVVGKAVAEYLTPENYNRRKNGHPPASDDCPECGQPAYIYAEMICVACHYEPGQYSECEVCGTPLDSEDAYSSVCSYHRYTMMHDD